MRHITLALGAALALAGCANSVSATNQTTAVYALGTAYQAAALAENGYETQPSANPATVATIKKDDATAFNLINPLVQQVAAGGTVTDAVAVAAAQAALNTLTNDLAQTGVK